MKLKLAFSACIYVCMSARRCFMPTPGIADQYIYRSLYGVQAYHCLKSMPRDQVRAREIFTASLIGPKRKH